MLARARALLDEAAGRTAPGSEEARRIELFSKTFRLTEMLVAIGNAGQVSRAMVDDARKHFRDVIIPDPMTIHARGERKELGNLVLEPVLEQITLGESPR